GGNAPGGWRELLSCGRGELVCVVAYPLEPNGGGQLAVPVVFGRVLRRGLLRGPVGRDRTRPGTGALGIVEGTQPLAGGQGDLSGLPLLGIGAHVRGGHTPHDFGETRDVPRLAEQFGDPGPPVRAGLVSSLPGEDAALLLRCQR